MYLSSLFAVYKSSFAQAANLFLDVTLNGLGTIVVVRSVTFNSSTRARYSADVVHLRGQYEYRGPQSSLPTRNYVLFTFSLSLRFLQSAE